MSYNKRKRKLQNAKLQFKATTVSKQNGKNKVSKNNLN